MRSDGLFVSGLLRMPGVSMPNFGKAFSVLAVVVLCSSIPGWATAITVNNASFESPAQVSGGASVTAPTNWTAGIGSNAFGVFFPTIPAEVNSVPDLNQVAYLTSSSTTGANIAQDVGVLQANMIYTLSVFLGVQKGVSLPSSYAIQLLDASSPGFVVNQTYVTGTPGVNPTSGNFVDFSVQFDSANFAAAVLAAHHVTINLVVGGGVQNGQILFDKVRLDASSDTPEPGSIGLALLGLGAVAVLRRRTAKSTRRKLI